MENPRYQLLLIAVALSLLAGIIMSYHTYQPDTAAASVAQVPHNVTTAAKLSSKPSKEAIQKPKPTPKPKPIPLALPFGGRSIFPDYRFVALYGTPDDPRLGVLGEQPAAAAIDRAKQMAASYQPFSQEPVIPTLEIITTIASSTPTDNGDYSQEVDINLLKPWIDAAEKAKVYVVLDLQSGRSDFLTQAKEYQELLGHPGVGLALDPEWRLLPNQVPIEQIGSVDAGEVNATAAWLADFTHKRKLPQKLFLLHQFRLDMILNRPSLNTTYPELAYAIQMDGNGSQPQKQDTWRSITLDPPANVRFGWKNFYDEDHPMLAPQETMAITPQPWYISYQ